MSDNGTPRAAAIYCRISADRAGEGLGVTRQEALCRDLAVRKGWTVTETYVDNDVSAYSGKPRPAYARMLAALDAGARDGVLVVDTDRLTRTPAELEGFIDLAERRGVALANVSGDVDLSTSDGRFKARIMGAVARQESEKKGERQRREREQSARAGKPPPGKRGYGYETDLVTVRPAEAKMIREAAARVLAGEALRAICVDWNDRGITPPGKAAGWQTATLRGILLNPRTAGLRRHRSRDRHGNLVSEAVYPAVWEAILDREEWESVTKRIAGNGTRRTGRPAVYLLSGIARCGLCGQPLYASLRADGRGRYACIKSPGRPGCGRLAVVAEPLEGEVVARVLAALDSPGFTEALTATPDDDGPDLGGEIADAENRLDEIAGDYADGAISRREWLVARERLTDRIAAARRQLDAAGFDRVLAALPAGADRLAAAWEAGDVDWRRAVLVAVAARIEVAPATKRGNRFDPERVTITWRA